MQFERLVRRIGDFARLLAPMSFFHATIHSLAEVARENYPEADLRLLYRGGETLEVDGIRRLPIERFLRDLVPGRPLP